MVTKLEPIYNKGVVVNISTFDIIFDIILIIMKSRFFTITLYLLNLTVERL